MASKTFKFFIYFLTKEHCIEFAYNDFHWHTWRRYDSYKHFNDFLQVSYSFNFNFFFYLSFYIKFMQPSTFELVFPEKNLITKKNSPPVS